MVVNFAKFFLMLGCQTPTNKFYFFLSIVTNGAQLAFTSNIVTKLLYYFDNGSLVGFADYLYSSQIFNQNPVLMTMS